VLSVLLIYLVVLPLLVPAGAMVVLATPLVTTHTALGPDTFSFAFSRLAACRPAARLPEAEFAAFLAIRYRCPPLQVLVFDRLARLVALSGILLVLAIRCPLFRLRFFVNTGIGS
jgi:hypothetical protein